MFGKRGRFKPKRFGKGLTPVGWQGRVYALVGIGVLLGPYLGCPYTAGLWPATGLESLLTALPAADTWHILRAVRQDDQGDRREPAVVPPPALLL